MKHLTVIQSEFLKAAARDWDSFSYNEQKSYLQRHPKSKRKMTAKPDGPENEQLKEKSKDSLQQQFNDLSSNIQSKKLDLKKNELTQPSENKRSYSPNNFKKLLFVVVSSPFSTEYEAYDSGITANKLFGFLYEQCPNEEKNINKIVDYYEEALYANEEADNTDSDSKKNRLQAKSDKLVEKGEHQLDELFKKYPDLKIEVKHDDLKEMDEVIQTSGEQKLHD
jgi:hypothetical protein